MRHLEHEWMCFPTKISCNSHRIFTMYSYFPKKKILWRCSLYSQINNYHFICRTWYKSVKGSQSIPTKFDWPGQWHPRGAICSFAFENKFSVLRQKVVAFFFPTTRIWLSKVMYRIHRIHILESSKKLLYGKAPSNTDFVPTPEIVTTLFLRPRDSPNTKNLTRFMIEYGLSVGFKCNSLKTNQAFKDKLGCPRAIHYLTPPPTRYVLGRCPRTCKKI